MIVSRAADGFAWGHVPKTPVAAGGRAIGFAQWTKQQSTVAAVEDAFF